MYIHSTYWPVQLFKALLSESGRKLNYHIDTLASTVTIKFYNLYNTFGLQNTETK